MTQFQKEVVERLTKIEKELTHHIQRTDRLEELWEKTEKRYWLLVIGVLSAEIILATILNT